MLWWGWAMIVQKRGQTNSAGGVRIPAFSRERAQPLTGLTVVYWAQIVLA